MVHRVSDKKLSRSTNARKSLLRNLASSLVLHEKITTTLAKAKAARPFVEKLVTKAKEDTLQNRRYVLANLSKENVVRKLFELVGPTFKDRPGGYTRIIKLPPRSGDNSPMARLEFVENISEIAAKKKLATSKKEVKKDKKPGKRQAAAKPAVKKQKPTKSKTKPKTAKKE